jgi:hypothetical protein
MKKIKVNSLPEGFEVINGRIVEAKKQGGVTTGDQSKYGLVTTGTNSSENIDETSVRYSLMRVPRDEANIEAEGGETVLTDLNGDGKFGLYDIKGPRHNKGGVPLNLPPQSFVFSDFNKLLFSKKEMAEFGLETKKRLTPAKISKKYGLNEYHGKINDDYADDIQVTSAELMLAKNGGQLSKLAFMQEAKKNFSDGVPVSSHPYLISIGEDPIEFTAKVEEISRQQAQQQIIESLPPEQQMQIAALQQYMQQVDQQQQAQQQGPQDQGMQMPPEMQQMQGMQQGMPPQGMPPQGQGMMPPPPDMNPQQMAQMGYEVQDMSYAQTGTETSLKSAAEQFQQKDNENFLKERIIYRLNEHLSLERKGRDADDFTEKTQDKIKKLINILSTNDISSKDLKALEDDIIKDLPIDQWSSVLGRRINRVSNYINQKYKDNTVNIDEEPDVDDEWNPEIDSLPRITASKSDPNYTYQTPLEEEKVYNDIPTTDRQPFSIPNKEQEYIEQLPGGIDETSGSMLDWMSKQYAGDPIKANVEQENALPFLPDYTTPEDVQVPAVKQSPQVDSEGVYSDYKIAKEEYKAQGYSNEEAARLAAEDQSPQTGDDYIDKIIDYELKHGHSTGKGLPLHVAFKKSVTGIDFTGDEEEDRQKVKEWIQTIDDKYSEYPLELRKRMVDFEINSEDPRAAMMEAAGVITSKEKGSKEFYPNGSLDVAKVNEYWAEYGPEVVAMIEEDPASFINKFDAAKHRSYKFGTNSATSYPATHGPRVDMFNEDFEYDKWYKGQYYKYDKNKGTYIKSNQATTKEVEDILQQPEGTVATKTKVEETPDIIKQLPDTDPPSTGTVYKEGDDIPLYPSATADITPDHKIFLGNKDLRANYEALEKTFKDPNSPAAKGLILKFKEALNNNDYFGPNVSKSEKDKLRNLKEQEILDYFLMMQKRNLGAYAHELKGNVKISDLAQTGDPKGEYKKLYDRMGMSYDDATGFAAEAQQAAYIAYRDLLKDRDDGKLNDDQNNALIGYGIRQVGKKDEKYGIDAENNISRIEGYYGNTTLGQHSTYTPPKTLATAKVVEEDEPVKQSVTPVEPVEQKVKDPLVVPDYASTYRPPVWAPWMQDLILEDAIADTRINKYGPWQPPVQKPEVDYALEDERRGIAALNEQTNIMGQGMGAIMGSQQYAANMAQQQGKNAANLADWISKVNNRNVSTINKAFGQQANFDWMANQEQDRRNVAYHDDWNKTNELYDQQINARNKAAAEQRVNTITNAANTFNLNTINPYYAIDPRTGGIINQINSKAWDKAEQPTTQSFAESTAKFIRDYEAETQRPVTDKVIEAWMKQQYPQQQTPQETNMQRQYYRQPQGFDSRYSQMGGQYMQEGGEVKPIIVPFFRGATGI